MALSNLAKNASVAGGKNLADYNGETGLLYDKNDFTKRQYQHDKFYAENGKYIDVLKRHGSSPKEMRQFTWDLQFGNRQSVIEICEELLKMERKQLDKINEQKVMESLQKKLNLDDLPDSDPLKQATNKYKPNISSTKPRDEILEWFEGIVTNISNTQYNDCIINLKSCGDKNKRDTITIKIYNKEHNLSGEVRQHKFLPKEFPSIRSLLDSENLMGAKVLCGLSEYMGHQYWKGIKRI